MIQDLWVMIWLEQTSGLPRRVPPTIEFDGADLLAIEALCKERKMELNMVTQRLQTSIETPDTKQGPGIL
jgi:hypothetical protein